MTTEPSTYKPLMKGWTNLKADPTAHANQGDMRDGSVYLPEEGLQLAVNVALAAGRPLLLRGDPGTGKSSLAPFIARNRNARYYEMVVTSRTQAQDLLWKFDAVRKLSDAQMRAKGDPSLNDFNYVEPGPLWWVLDRESALRRGAPADAPVVYPATEPFGMVNAKRSPDRAVVLIDEIDKADPDVPNGLLVPLGSSEFRVEETGAQVPREGKAGAQTGETLIILTTNETRELPDAFLRRCVVHHLEHPGQERLVEIALQHAPRWGANPDKKLLQDVAKRLVEMREEARKRGWRQPSTAEFLDAVRACLTLGIKMGDPGWKILEQASLSKRPDQKPGLRMDRDQER